MADSRLQTGPRFLEPHLRQRVSEKTLKKYRDEILPFSVWPLERQYHPETAEEWDDLLVEYLYCHPALSRAKFSTLVAGVEFFFQRFRNRLSWCHGVLSGWETGAQVRHTVPLGKGVAKLIMVHVVSWGFLRLGIGVILQTETGLRPSELLRLRPEDFLFPEEEGSNLRVRPLRIGLGIRGGTKVKRAQFVLLDKRCWRLVRVLRVLKLSTPQGLLVFPESYSTFRLLLRRVEAQLGLSVGWTPHSGRAGYASDSRAEGVPFEEVREQGRWQSDSSLRRYLDIVGASSMGVRLRAAGLAKALEVLATRWTEWVDIEALEYAA